MSHGGKVRLSDPILTCVQAFVHKHPQIAKNYDHFFVSLVLRLTIFDSASPSLEEGDPPASSEELAGEVGRASAVLEPVDQFNSLTEVAGFDGHDHVDGIEVFLTPEAAGQVGFGVGGGLEFTAQGTQEAEVSLRDLAGDV
jgi:hypothetical protein